MKNNYIILFSLFAIFIVFGLDISFVKKVKASNELSDIPDINLEVEKVNNVKKDEITDQNNIIITDQEEQVKIEQKNNNFTVGSEFFENDQTNFSNIDNIKDKEILEKKEGQNNLVNINNDSNQDTADKELNIISDSQSNDQEFERLVSEALEEDDVDKKQDKDQKKIFNKAEIKEETDINQLDKDEFDIEIIEKIIPKSERKQIINNKKLVGNKEENLQKENKIDNITKLSQEENQEQILSSKAQQILAIESKKKFSLPYLSHTNHPLFSPAEYNPENPHLNPLIYQEEIYQILYTAIIQKNIDVIEAVTKKIGVNKDIAVNGMPPIAFAVNEGDIHILSKLLSLGYSPNIYDDNGNSPLHMAIFNDRSDMIVELIRFGADITAANAVKMRPLNLAYNLGREDIIYILEKIGARNIGDYRSLNSFILEN